MSFRLIEKSTDNTLGIVAGQFALPDGSIVAPVYAGWENNEYRVEEYQLPPPDPEPEPTFWFVPKYAIVKRVQAMNKLPDAVASLNAPSNAELRMLYDSLMEFRNDDIPMRTILGTPAQYGGVGLTPEEVEAAMALVEASA